MSDIAVQDYDPELFELIVVNDNSSDSTFDTASSFKGIKNLKVINNKGKGKKKAIRTGVEASAGNSNNHHRCRLQDRDKMAEHYHVIRSCSQT